MKDPSRLDDYSIQDLTTPGGLEDPLGSLGADPLADGAFDPASLLADDRPGEPSADARSEPLELGWEGGEGNTAAQDGAYELGEPFDEDSTEPVEVHEDSSSLGPVELSDPEQGADPDQVQFQDWLAEEGLTGEESEPGLEEDLAGVTELGGETLPPFDDASAAEVAPLDDALELGGAEAPLTGELLAGEELAGGEDELELEGGLGGVTDPEAETLPTLDSAFGSELSAQDEAFFGLGQAEDSLSGEPMPEELAPEEVLAGGSAELSPRYEEAVPPMELDGLDGPEDLGPEEESIGAIQASEGFSAIVGDEQDEMARGLDGDAIGPDERPHAGPFDAEEAPLDASFDPGIADPAAGSLEWPESQPILRGTHRVVVQTLDGRVKRGLLADFDPAASHLELETPHNGAHQAVPAEMVRAIFFMLAPGQRARPVEGRKVRATFTDGRRVGGFCPDFRDDAVGFFLVPQETRTTTGKIWIYRSALSEVSAT